MSNQSLFPWCKLYQREYADYSITRRDLIADHNDIIQKHAFTCTVINLARISQSMSASNKSWRLFWANYGHIYNHYNISWLVNECNHNYKAVTSLYLAASHKELLTALKNRKSNEYIKEERNEYKKQLACSQGYVISKFITRDKKNLVIFEGGERFVKVNGKYARPWNDTFINRVKPNTKNITQQGFIHAGSLYTVTGV